MKKIKKTVSSCVFERRAEGVLAAALAVCCMSLQALSVTAASGNEISLTAKGSEADIELYFPGEAADGVSSMQISVSVTAASGEASAEFIPDSSLPAKIVESRYQSDSGTLNIYIAGTEKLFSQDGSASLGKIIVGGNAGDAAVGVVRDSIRFVKNGELVSPDSDTAYPAAVTVTAGEQSSPDRPVQPSPEIPGQTLPVVPEAPNTPGIVYPEYPGGNIYPDISISFPDIGSSSPSSPENTDSSFSPVTDWPEYDSETPYAEPESITGDDDTPGAAVPVPPDMSPLLEAMARADGVNEDEYTSDSYAGLNKAVESARDTVYDPYATQSDIDNARLDIENAMGMLTPGNDIPSGAAGYSEKTENAANSSPDNSGQLDSMDKVLPDTLGSPRADNATADSSVQTAAITEEKQESSARIVLCIVLIAAVFVCAAVIGIKHFRGKQTFGSHYRK